MTTSAKPWIQARIKLGLAVIEDASQTQLKSDDAITVADWVERLYGNQEYMEVHALELDRIMNVLPEQY